MLTVVSKKLNQICKGDLIWKHIVYLYYPAFIADNLSSQYYSALRKILDNRKEITYNSRQHPYILIQDLNFDGTKMSGFIKNNSFTHDTFVHAEFKDGCFKILDKSNKNYSYQDRQDAYDRNQVSDDGLLKLIYNHNYKIRNIWTKDKGKEELLPDRQFSKKSALSKDGNRFITQLWENSTHAQILVHLRGGRRLIFLDDIFDQTYQVVEYGLRSNRNFFKYPINYNSGYGRERTEDTGFVIEHMCMNYLGNKIAMKVSNLFYQENYMCENPAPSKNESLSFILSLPCYRALEEQGIKFKNPDYRTLTPGKNLRP